MQLPLVQLKPTLTLAHTTDRAAHDHLSSTSSILVVWVLINDSASTFLQFLLFEFDRFYFLFNFLDLVFEVFLKLLCFLELLLNDESVVSLQDLFIHEIAPRTCVHLVVKVVLIQLVLRHLAESAESKIN